MRYRFNDQCLFVFDFLLKLYTNVFTVRWSAHTIARPSSGQNRNRAIVRVTDGRHIAFRKCAPSLPSNQLILMCEWMSGQWSARFSHRKFSKTTKKPYKADITRRRCDNDDDDVDVCAVVVVIFCRLFFLLIIIYFFYFKLNQPLETRMRALVLAHSSSFALWRGANTRWHIFTR